MRAVLLHLSHAIWHLLHLLHANACGRMRYRICRIYRISEKFCGSLRGAGRKLEKPSIVIPQLCPIHHNTISFLEKMGLQLPCVDHGAQAPAKQQISAKVYFHRIVLTSQLSRLYRICTGIPLAAHGLEEHVQITLIFRESSFHVFLSLLCTFF